MSRLPWWPILIGLALVAAAVVAGLVLAFGRGGGVAAVRPTPAGPPGRIAYVTTRGGLVSIVVADGSGRHARLLDPAPGIQQYQPAWSRGAKLLVYVGLVHGDPSTAEILVSAPSGASFRQLTRNFWEDDFPTWSPDGRIAFYSFRPQGAGIYVMDASGRHQRLLAATTDPTSWAPAWAPDGKSIAGGTGDAAILIWDSATGKVESILKDEDQFAPVTALAFSHDGKSLASASATGLEVWLWDLAHSEPRLLIPDAIGGCAIECLAFHPQDRWLAVGGIDWLATGGSDGRHGDRRRRPAAVER